MHYAFQSESKLFFVLDYCPGGELFFHLHNCKRFNQPTARFFASNIVLALEHLHSLDIVYRDLKPENVLIDRYGYCILTDFGLSKQDIGSKTLTKSICGTPEYLAPEILLQKGYGQAVDWWSLGCIIYEMLFGFPPFYDESQKRLLQKILRTEYQLPAQLDPSIQNLLQGLLEKDPQNRLGNREYGVQELKAHPWFNGVKWQLLKLRKSKPPFVPELRSDSDDSFISKVRTSTQSQQFTGLPIESPSTNGSQNHMQYSNFTFDRNRMAATIEYEYEAR